MKFLIIICAVVFSSNSIAEDYYGTSSWYKGDKKTAQGKKFNPNKYSVAHRTLPFGTMLKLTNVKNGNVIQAVVADRGPYIKGRELDVSSSAAQALGFFHSGTAKLLIEILEKRD